MKGEPKLTMTSAFEELYPHDELGKRTIQTYRAAIRFWERLMGSPDLHTVDNALLEKFRRLALEELAPYTVNRYWGRYRTVLRRLGPPVTGNPWGLSILPTVPAMRPCKVPFKRPRRLSMEELSKVYLACRHMRYPCRNVPVPPFWWQGLLTLTFNTGLRLGDLLAAKWSDINPTERTLFVKLNKTGVEADLPLTDLTMAHLDRLERRGERIFNIAQRKFFTFQRQLREQAGVDFTWHDVRRTACSEADAARPGMGKVLLLHAPADVTQTSYLNSLPELRATVEAMAVPLAFKHGPRMVLRALKEVRKEVLRAPDFAVPLHPPRELFGFSETAVMFAGKVYTASPRRITIIRTLVENDCNATQQQLWAALFGTPFPSGRARHERLPLMRDLSSTRAFLRRVLGLPKGYNPIVATLLHESRQGRFCRFELFLPPQLWDGQKPDAA